jgi:aspartyl-tRNA(Asn)/glutamyl-tRNA(Gln) amidotransferase subunit C
MSIDIAALEKTAKLARIRLTDAEKAHFSREMNGILGWAQQLQSIDTDAVAPLASVSDIALPWREDKVTDGHCAQAVLSNAPASEYGCFVVPKVIE